MSGPPIFVVGCHRSGTTLFRLILDSHPAISCGPETRFLADLEKITNAANWPRMGLYGFPKSYWHERVAELWGDVYPELREHATHVGRVLSTEEERFSRTLEVGGGLLDDVLARSGAIVSGEDAFKLHDTFGFPIDLTIEIAGEREVPVDIAGYETLMEEQRLRSSAGAGS